MRHSLGNSSLGFSLAAARTHPVPASWPCAVWCQRRGRSGAESQSQGLPSSTLIMVPTVPWALLSWWPAGLTKPGVLVLSDSLKSAAVIWTSTTLISLLGEWRFSLNFATGHGLWVQRYQEKKSLFDVPESDGTSLSPVPAAVYSFLTMIIVLQVTILSSVC